MDFTKIDDIIKWPTPRNFHDIHSFYRLVTFYHRFIQNFSTIMTLMTDCLKINYFKWTTLIDKSFEEIKVKMTQALILQLPDVNKVFEVTYDVFRLGIGRVLSQENDPIAYFSEKLNDAKLKYSTYNKEFYVIIQSLYHWQHYLLSKEFILYFNHEGLKYLHS